jgi:hypothetical protein
MPRLFARSPQPGVPQIKRAVSFYPGVLQVADALSVRDLRGRGCIIGLFVRARKGELSQESIGIPVLFPFVEDGKVVDAAAVLAGRRGKGWKVWVAILEPPSVGR